MRIAFVLDPAEVSFSAIRAQGAGGQNVNKVSNAVHLRFDVRASSLPEALKERLDDPVTYFLGPNAERVVYPSATSKHFGFPASKDYVFSHVPSARVASRGFEPLVSFARGGLAEAWTGGCYEFGDAQLERFPISFADLRPHYAEVARRVGISAERDDIERFSPFTAPYLPPLAIDEHSRRLLLRYGERRTRLNAALGFVQEMNRDAVTLWLYFQPHSIVATPDVGGLTAVDAVQFADYQPKPWLGQLWLKDGE